MTDTLITGLIACGIIAAGWGALRVVQWVRGGGEQLEQALERALGPVYEAPEPYVVLEDLAPARGSLGSPVWEDGR